MSEHGQEITVCSRAGGVTGSSGTRMRRARQQANSHKAKRWSYNVELLRGRKPSRFSFSMTKKANGSTSTVTAKTTHSCQVNGRPAVKTGKATARLFL